jgi:hypothetical protein
MHVPTKVACLLLPYIQGTAHSVTTKVLIPAAPLKYQRPILTARPGSLAVSLDSQHELRPHHLRTKSRNFAAVFMLFVSLPGLSNRRFALTTVSVCPEDLTGSLLLNSAAFYQTTRHHVPDDFRLQPSGPQISRVPETHTNDKCAAFSVIKK